MMHVGGYHEYIEGLQCAGIAFIQGDSAGSSKLIEQTLRGLLLYTGGKVVKKLASFPFLWQKVTIHEFHATLNP